MSDWPIKKTFRTDKLEGELVPKSNFLQQLIDNPYTGQIDKAEMLHSTNSHVVYEENCLNNSSNTNNDMENCIKL